MSDVGGKLLGRFADCLATELAGTGAAPAPAEAVPASAEAPTPAAVLDAQPASAAREAAPAGTRTPAATAGSFTTAAPPGRPEGEAIDLVEAAGGAVAKRLVPVLGVLALLAVLVAVLRRRR
jgi:hypothetical protein